MFRSYWIAVIALGLACIASPAEAQNGQPHSDNEQHQSQSPNTGSEPPAIENAGESDGDAERNASERIEAHSDKREINPLSVQEGIERALVRLADSGDHQTIIVGIGTGLLLATLILTGIANWLTWRAVKITREIGQAQVRAYIAQKSLHIQYLGEISGEDRFGAIFTVTNCGTSTALAVRVDKFSIASIDGVAPPEKSAFWKQLSGPVNILPTADNFWGGFFTFPLGTHQAMINRGSVIFVGYRVTYNDVFGVQHTETFLSKVDAEFLKEDMVLSAEFQPENS